MNATTGTTIKYKKIKTITSHSGLGRFMGLVSQEPIREIPRIAEIPSPYVFSPTHPVWRYCGKEVFIVETKHKHYEVYEILG